LRHEAPAQRAARAAARRRAHADGWRDLRLRRSRPWRHTAAAHDPPPHAQRERAKAVETTPVMPSLLSHIAREYRRKLLKRFRPAAVRDPWMRYWEIEIVEDVLRSLQPRRSLEWGSGYSTLSFTRLLPPDAHWLSLEHDRPWYERVLGLAAEATGPRAKVEFHCLPPNQQPWTDPHQDGAAADLVDYIAFPATRGPFDFILVDGRARVECLTAARDLVHPDGIVMLHDANRSRYHAPFGLYAHQVSFLDHRSNAGGLWLGSPGRDIGSLIDVPAQQARWRRATRAGKLLRI
jgi:predicted O-methyltransferase YrrM